MDKQPEKEKPIWKSPMEIFKEMQMLTTREEMIAYLRSLPRKEE